MANKCKGCKYFCETTRTCDFILIVGRRRGCPADNCTEKIVGEFDSRVEIASNIPSIELDEYDLYKIQHAKTRSEV